MDFFSHFIKQPPVPDKDNNDIGSIYSQQFSITKDKRLKGFNDDVSEIQVGSQNINDDSMNSIKREHKLLSGRRQSDQRSKPYYNESKQNSRQQIFQLGTVQSPQAQKKDSKNSKLSLQSKFTSNQKLNAEGFVNLHRQYSLGSKNMPFKMHLPTQNKSHSYVLNQIKQLRLIKQQLKQLIVEQAKRYKKLIESTKIGLQIQIKKRINLLALNAQRNSQHQIGSKNIDALEKKLKQAEQYVKQLKYQLDDTCRQNQILQQKLFDMEQKVVGIDLEVEQRFQNKRKQLQKKIYDQIMNRKQMANAETITNRKNKQINSSQIPQNNNNQTVISNLISQNKNLQAKCKSYQTMLLQNDHFRKLKQQLEQKQQSLKQKQKQIRKYEQETDKNLRQNAKKSLDLQSAQENLNKRINSLKQNLKCKEDELKIWQQELNLKSKLIEARGSIQPNNKLSSYNTGQTYNLTFQKQPQNSLGLTFKQYNQLQNIPQRQNKSYQNKQSQNQIYKIQGFNIDRLSTPRTNNQQLDTFRKLENQQKNQDRIQRSSTQLMKNSAPVYDPRKHENYERFDLKDKQIHQHHYYQKNHYENNTDRLNSPRNYDSISSSNMSNRHLISSPKNRMGSFKLLTNNHNVQKVSPQFYKPIKNSSFKYQSQYMKPSSVPLSHPNGLTSIKQPFVSNTSSVAKNTGNLNKTRQQGATSSYTHLGINRNNYRDKQSSTSGQRQNLGGFARSNYSKSSKDNSHNYGNYKQKVSYQGYDMNKSKNKFQVGNLSSLGNKLQILKSELKNQIDSIL